MSKIILFVCLDFLCPPVSKYKLEMLRVDACTCADVLHAKVKYQKSELTDRRNDDQVTTYFQGEVTPKYTASSTCYRAVKSFIFPCMEAYL